MLPRTLAFIDAQRDFTQHTADNLRRRGIQVDIFGSAQALLAASLPFAYGFYVVDLDLPGMDGCELIARLRQECQTGVLVVSGRLGNGVFRDAVDAGADMFLSKPTAVDQVAVAVRAVYRRSGTVIAPEPTNGAWILDRHACQLVAPDGARVDLSEGDLKVMDCFVAAQGNAVQRETLRLRLGRPEHTEVDDGLNATIYRLRKRIERATPMLVPLQSRSRVGYVFRAPLMMV